MRIATLALLVVVTARLAAETVVNVSTVDQLRSAVADAQPGNAIVLAPGTYSVTDMLGLWAVGTPAQPIALRGGAGARPIIDAIGSSSTIAIIGITGQYWRLSGLEIRNSTPNSACGVSIWGATGCEMHDCWVHETANTGIITGGGSTGTVIADCSVYHTNRNPPANWGQGISLKGGGTVRDCHVYENRGEGIGCYLGTGAVIVGNRVHDNFGANIYLDNARDAVIDRNFVYTTWNTAYYRSFGGEPAHQANGVHLANENYGGEVNPLSNNRITNNVIVNAWEALYYGRYQNGGGMKSHVFAHNTCWGAGDRLIHIDADAHENTVFANNIFVAGGKPMLGDYSGPFTTAPAGITFHHNLWWNGASAGPSGIGDKNLDPKLVNPTTNIATDYALAADSPAADAGATSPSSAHDHLQASRPSGSAPDLGAFERQDSMPPVTLRNPENPAGAINGLDYTYYEGIWSILPTFSGLTAAKAGVSTTGFDLGVRNRDDNFAIRFVGYIHVAADGAYTFSTSSDDGSRLWIGSTLVVDNDGAHAAQERSGSIGLKAGTHALTVGFFEATGGQSLSVQWQGPSLAKATIPSNALYRVPSPGGGGSTLPIPWQAQDVGAVAAVGSASYASGVFTVSGSGADIWGTSDEFQAVTRTFTGDGEIVARIVAVGNSDPWAKAGVMIRESLTGGARHALMAVTPGNGVAFQRRPATAEASSHTAGSNVRAPYWVKLMRSGTTLSGYQSADGSTWQLVGSVTIALPATVQACLVVTSHRDGTLCTATFDHVTVIAAPAADG
jgi:hypothetical protein